MRYTKAQNYATRDIWHVKSDKIYWFLKCAQRIGQQWYYLVRKWKGDATSKTGFVAAAYSSYDRVLALCIAYLSTFLNKVQKWQFPMTFSCWAYDLVLKVMSRPINANVPCCESSLLFHINDKFGCPWRFKCNSATNQVQLLASGLRTGHMTSL